MNQYHPAYGYGATEIIFNTREAEVRLRILKDEVSEHGLAVTITNSTL